MSPSTLTPKEKQHLSELHSRVGSGTFSETDVSALLVLLRHKSGNGAILELGNSIVHSERDSGQFFQRIRANQKVLNKLGKKPGVVDGRHIISADDFAANLDDTFVQHGLAPLDRSANDLVLLCGLSLLQGGSVNAGTKFGELSLALTSESFELLATTPVKNNGKVVHVVFSVASVSNRWLPICNPRSLIKSHGEVRVVVREFLPIVNGFRPFEVHVERAPPIGENDIAKLIASEPKLSRTPGGLTYTPSGGPSMPLHYDGSRLTVPGLPEFFRGGSEYERMLKAIRLRLGACVHDDSGAHWFLEGLAIAPDGFHSHWVGRGSATCTRPL